MENKLKCNKNDVQRDLINLRWKLYFPKMKIDQHADKKREQRGRLQMPKENQYNLSF